MCLLPPSKAPSQCPLHINEPLPVLPHSNPGILSTALLAIPIPTAPLTPQSGYKSHRICPQSLTDFLRVQFGFLQAPELVVE